MTKILLTFLPVLLCLSRIVAQTVYVFPEFQNINCNSTATIDVWASGETYNATVTGGLVINDNGVDKTSLVTDQPSLTIRAVSGGGEVIITLVSYPGVTGTARIHINSLILSNITGNPCIPATGTGTYAITPIPGASYRWQIRGGDQHTRILSGTTTNEVTIESIDEGNSLLTVFVLNDCITDSNAAPTRSIQIKKIFTLDEDEIIKGPTCIDASVLGADSTVTYSVKHHLGQYNSFPDYGWTTTSGLQLRYTSPGRDSINLKVIDATVDQQISVNIGQVCNEQNNILTKTLKVPITIGPISYYVDSDINNTCISKGYSQAVTFSIAAVPGVTSYSWTFPAEWAAGPVTTTSPSITVLTDETNGGIVTVTANDLSECSNTAALEVARQGLDFCIDVFPLSPSYKFYSIDPENILNGTAIYFKWYIGSATVPFIAGEEESLCPVRNNAGTVRVEITDSNGCKTSFTVSTSTPAGTSVCNYSIGSTSQRTRTTALTTGSQKGIPSIAEFTDKLQLSPNPAADRVSVVLPTDITQANMTIYNTNSRQIDSIHGVKNNVTLDVSQYENGIYYIIISSSSGLFYDKFIVKH